MRVCGAGLVLGRVEWEAGSHRAGLDGVHPFSALACQGGGAVAVRDEWCSKSRLRH